MCKHVTNKNILWCSPNSGAVHQLSNTDKILNIIMQYDNNAIKIKKFWEIISDKLKVLCSALDPAFTLAMIRIHKDNDALCLSGWSLQHKGRG